MKFLVFPFVVLFIVFSCKPSSRKAAAYNDSIIARIKKVTLADDEFWKSVSDTSGNTMVLKANGLQKQIHVSASEINSMEEIDKQDTLKKAALQYLNSIESLLAADYAEIIKIAQNRERTEEEAAKANQMIEEAQEKRRAAKARLAAVQNSFADKYNIRLEHK